MMATTTTMATTTMTTTRTIMKTKLSCACSYLEKVYFGWLDNKKYIVFTSACWSQYELVALKGCFLRLPRASSRLRATEYPGTLKGELSLRMSFWFKLFSFENEKTEMHSEKQLRVPKVNVGSRHWSTLKDIEYVAPFLDY